MPQQISLKPVNTFNKGLVTEATVMTFPEGATSDELNCDLLKNGARQRRRGLAFEENYQLSTFSVAPDSFVHTDKWENVSGIGGTEFLVVQVNNMVYFYDKSGSTVSANQKSFSINLYDYDVANDYDAAAQPIDCSSITGYLVIVSPALDPIRVDYDILTDTISVSKIDLRIRDFQYLGMSSNILTVSRTSNVVTVTTSTSHYLVTGDTVNIDCTVGDVNGTFTVTGYTTYTFTYTKTGSDISSTSATGYAKETYYDDNPDVTPSKVTINYRYDLYNMGWREDFKTSGNTYAYAVWDSSNSDFPPRNKPWYVGIVDGTSSNDASFVRNLYQGVSYGKTLAPNGYYILDFFNQDRSTASGIAGLTTITENARFTCTTAYAGRVWYAGLDSKKNGGKIFFSKVIENQNDLGKCYQINSPTARDSANLIDSDGGYIIIPDISDIKALYASGSILFIFASNGVWAIGGVDQIFKATEYYVSKISNFGMINQNTLVDVSGTPIYWGTSGIYSVSYDTNAKPTVSSISDSIKTFYDNIPNLSKSFAVSVFDRLNRRIYWVYQSEDETISNKKNNILVLDLDLQAFFPWQVADTTGTTPYILDVTYLSGQGSESSDFNVLAASDQVIDSSSNLVVQTISGTSAIPAEIKFITRTSTGYLTFAEFNSRYFYDWNSADYSSYAETGYDFYGSATVKKNTPYITTYMKRTEENFVPDGLGYSADYPSGCSFITKWDLSVSDSRWSQPQQIYRMVNYPVANPDDLTFNYPYDTIVTKTKIRGKGRVMRMRFESETGKDFYLIGWEIISATNPRY